MALNNPIKLIWFNSVSFLSMIVVVINLGFWMFPIFFLAALKKILNRNNKAREVIISCIEFIYIAAVKLNSFWIKKILRINLSVEGNMPTHSAPIVVANHQTWFDIPILQGLICDSGTIAKFLIKRELAWLPIVGWLCFALGFPRLYRGKGARSRDQDLASIQSVSAELREEPGALLIFAEGTRYTETKYKKQKSPYEGLLKPKTGGLEIALKTVLPETPVVDVTIKYLDEDTNFWRWLSGSKNDIAITIKQFRADEITNTKLWLDERWKHKEHLLNL